MAGAWACVRWVTRNQEREKNERIEPLDVETHLLGNNGVFPNNGRLPLLVYRHALKAGAAAEVRRRLAQNRWGGSWVNGIYEFHHYHSTAHEVLVVCGGEAEVQFGGEQGLVATVSAGDVVVIPAGVAHKNLGSSSDFAVLGAYPEGQSYDMCYGKEGERPGADENIARVASPQSDPVQGSAGALMRHWVR